tara:strand:+ start:1351 stop:1470 length:120 start_codon:yes stop_codon:yes gene_type:complete
MINLHYLKTGIIEAIKNAIEDEPNTEETIVQVNLSHFLE